MRYRTPLDGEPIPSKAIVPAKPKSTAVTAPDDRSYRTRYLDEVAPSGIAGRMIKFDGKSGGFITPDDGEPVPESTVFFALADEALVGWVKFNGEGEPPDREMGLLYDGYVMPVRESLGDLDQEQWEEGLDGAPADPWQHHIYLPLQNSVTLELFTFVTSSKTGRRAVGTLLRHFDRMRRTAPDEIPVIKLGKGGFHHRDDRIGFVVTPTFIVLGKSPRDGVAAPDTSTAGILNDKVNF
jgi:hypothetical protein